MEEKKLKINLELYKLEIIFLLIYIHVIQNKGLILLD